VRVNNYLTLINIPFRTINRLLLSIGLDLHTNLTMNKTKIMKRVILMLGILVCLLATRIVMAQQQGVITYENRMNMHMNIPPEREAMKAQIPEFRITKMQLIFNADESLYKPLAEDEEEQFGSGNMRMTFRMPKTETYTNSSTTAILSLQELMGKKYTIMDTIKMSPWKLGTETKEILGYTCRMAYYTHTQEITTMRMNNGTLEPEKKTITQEITAWYTDQIRPALGPERYNTLPGTVLAIDINNGERVIVARNVELRELKKGELKVPDAGTKVTQEEFKKISEEQMEKMRANSRTFMRN
jgi:GLPGLI family protein